MIDRKTFYTEIRASLFRSTGLSMSAVVTINAILDEAERRKIDDRWLAYMLATVRGECGPNMSPVREGYGKTDAASRAHVARQGYKYAKVVNGHVYYGRGLVQLTWDFNYASMGKLLGIDLLGNPELALRPDVAVKIMFEGMIRGTFTGKKLSDYFNDVKTDWANARRIINGTDKATQFAAWAEKFYAAIKLARTAQPAAPAPKPGPEPAPKPVPAPATGKKGLFALIGVMIASGIGWLADHIITVLMVIAIFGVIGAAVLLHKKRGEKK
jgi:hypothetical protein